MDTESEIERLANEKREEALKLIEERRNMGLNALSYCVILDKSLPIESVAEAVRKEIEDMGFTVKANEVVPLFTISKDTVRLDIAW